MNLAINTSNLIYFNKLIRKLYLIGNFNDLIGLTITVLVIYSQVGDENNYLANKSFFIETFYF